MTFFSKIFSRNNLHLYVGVTVGAIAVSCNVLPHTVFLQKYAELFTYTRFSKVVTPNEETLKRFKEVMNDLALPENVQQLLKPFTIIGFDTGHAGTFRKPYGGVVGIPENYNFKDVSEVDGPNIIVNREPILWEHEEGQNFMDTLILSKEAQKFTMAYEILRIQKEEQIITAIGLAVAIAILLFVYHSIYVRFKLKKEALLTRLGIQSIFVFLATASRMGLADIQSYINDKKIDKYLSELGLEYVIGGKEHYEKQLERNKAIKYFMGLEGETKIHDNGNFKHYVRFPARPLTEKKRFFEEKLGNTYSVA